MTNARALIDRLAVQEARLRQTTFLAPCVPGGAVRTGMDRLVYTFAPEPATFTGWGLFRPVDAARAALVDAARLRQVDAYLRLFPAFRLHLAFPLRPQTWLAFPANASDARQRTGDARPVPVHLVKRSAAFEPIVARWDGNAWWFEAEDRRSEPRMAAYLRTAFKQETLPKALRYKGLTPEMRTAYALAWQRTAAGRRRRQQARDASRLDDALRFAGGKLQDFHDREDFWLVEWTTPDGEQHRSAIRKDDLTVLSAGICLSDQDQAFDLQSLVSVITDRPDWMH